MCLYLHPVSNQVESSARLRTLIQRGAPIVLRSYTATQTRGPAAARGAYQPRQLVGGIAQYLLCY